MAAPLTGLSKVDVSYTSNCPCHVRRLSRNNPYAFKRRQLTVSDARTKKANYRARRFLQRHAIGPSPTKFSVHGRLFIPAPFDSRPFERRWRTLFRVAIWAIRNTDSVHSRKPLGSDPNVNDWNGKKPSKPAREELFLRTFSNIFLKNIFRHPRPRARCSYNDVSATVTIRPVDYDRYRRFSLG